MAKAIRQPGRIFELEISLQQVTPRIWRQFAVLETVTLAKLHQIIQVVMGWGGCHLHEFKIGADCNGEPDPDMPFNRTLVDESWIRLLDFLGGKGSRFHYEYDFGEGWVHELEVINVGPPDPSIRYPVCLAGARACPTRDCGSVSCYHRLLKILADPRDRDYREIADWLGDRYDPEKFDLKAVNQRLHDKWIDRATTR